MVWRFHRMCYTNTQKLLHLTLVHFIAKWNVSYKSYIRPIAFHEIGILRGGRLWVEPHPDKKNMNRILGMQLLEKQALGEIKWIGLNRRITSGFEVFSLRALLMSTSSARPSLGRGGRLGRPALGGGGALIDITTHEMLRSQRHLKRPISKNETQSILKYSLTI
jgi:hypothetical protein